MASAQEVDFIIVKKATRDQQLTGKIDSIC